MTQTQLAQLWLIAVAGGRRSAKLFLHNENLPNRGEELDAALAQVTDHTRAHAKDLIRVDPSVKGYLSVACYTRARTILGLPPVAIRP